MNEQALQKQIQRLDSELEMSNEYYRKQFIELRGEMDRIKLEIAALRSFLEGAFPDFAERFPEILEKTIREVNPEFN